MKFFVPNEFKLNKMVKNPHILIIAKKGHGKSILADNLIKYLIALKPDSDPDISIACPAERLNPFYQPKYPDAKIIYNLREKFFKKLLIEASTDIENKKDANRIVVLDDCFVKMKNWCKNETVTEILMNNRHYDMPYIVIIQTPYGITPDIRLNFDYIFLLKEDSAINKQKLWDNYASMFPTYSTFEKVFTEYTKNFCCMVIDNRTQQDDINDKVFWFRAKYSDDEENFTLPETIYFDDDENLVYSDYFTPLGIYLAPVTQELVFTSVNKNDLTKINNDNSLKINYKDNNYEFSVTLNDLNNHETVKTLCYHITDVKNSQLEYLKLLNENLRLRLELNKDSAL